MPRPKRERITTTEFPPEVKQQFDLVEDEPAPKETPKFVNHPELNTTVVKPSIEFSDKKHILVSLFEGDEALLPTLKSVGYSKVPGTNNFIAYTITSRGTKIIRIDAEEPNIRPIAEETAKIFFVNAFMDGDPNV